MSRLNSFLQGLRVVDISAYLAGPMTSLLLADMGADVLKVEPPQGDDNSLALAGVLHHIGVPPRFFDQPVADVTSSLFATLAILGATDGRRQDGVGCHIDLSIADDVAMPLQLFEVAACGANGTVPQPEETDLNGGAAYYHIYPTVDRRHVVVGAVESKFLRSFCQAAGHSDWIARQNEALPQHTLIGDVATFFASIRLADCEARFAAADCYVTSVLDLAEALRSAHHRMRGVVHPDPNGSLQALFPTLIDGQPPAVRPDFQVVEGLTNAL